MKKTTAVTLAAMMAIASVGTMVNAETNEGKGVYTLYNSTGENLKEIFLYENGAEDKGENLIPDGLKANKKVVATFEGSQDAVLTLEFTTENDVTAAFETLHVEVAPVSMLSLDAVSGATVVNFAVPQGTGKYTLINTTGEDISELYVYPVAAKEESEEATEEAAEEVTEEVTEAEAEAAEVAEIEKGENLAGEGLADGASVDFSFTGDIDTELTIEFVTETDGAKYFRTLHIEEVKINLLAADAMTGATSIEFTF